MIEAFSTTCDSCNGRGIHIHTEPVRAKAAAPVFAGHHDEHEVDADSTDSSDEPAEQPQNEARGTKPRKRRRAVSTGVVTPGN